MSWINKGKLRQIEASLEQGNHSQKVLSLSPTTVLTIDRQFNITFINNKGAEVIGRKVQDCIGKKCFDLFKTDHCRTSDCRCQMAMKQDGVFQGETVLDPSGLGMPIKYTGAPFKNDDGEIIGAVEYIDDLTLVKKYQVDAGEKLNYLNLIPTPVMAIDREYKVLFINDFGLKALNISLEQAQKSKCYDLFRTAHCKTEECRLKQAMKYDSIQTGETVANLPSGKLPIRYSGTPLKDDYGNVIGAVEFVADITEITSVVQEINKTAENLYEGKLDRRALLNNAEGQYATLINAFNKAIDNILEPLKEAVKLLALMADGDLSSLMTGEYRGDHALMKNSLNTTLDSLNATLTQVYVAADQVNSGSGQVSDSSQALSQGATEQASSLEETTASMSELESQTRQNAENAEQANLLSNETQSSAEKGNQQMNRMLEAMAEINESSGQISKIIKTIEEIAFQTNLLALNAAVEAARAGVHGKGFAVVAEEVRNLAQRSAKAAGETTDLIEGTVKRVANGTLIANSTAKAFAEIAKSVTKVTDITAEIASASREQSMGISQVNQGLSQIDQVTQNNAANAEESASASEELSAQAQQLQQMLARFRLNNTSDEGFSNVAISANSITGSSFKTRKSGNNGQSNRLPAGQFVHSNPDLKNVKVTQHVKCKVIDPEEVISLDDDDFGGF